MVEIMNWYLSFIKQCVEFLFSVVSIDGYSLGYMVLAVIVVATVISATIGAVALSSRMIRDNSYAASSRARFRARNAAVDRKLSNIERSLE